MKIKPFYILLLVFNFSFAQEKTTLFFNDGSSKTGLYKIRENSFGVAFLNRETKEKYKLKEISKAIVFRDTIECLYEVIDVKTNYDDKKTEKKFCLLVYSSPKMRVYYNNVFNYSSQMIMDDVETYVKKNEDTIAYNLGYIYGVQARGILKRVEDYFTDCPQLIDLVKNNKIKKTETIKMVEFYEKNCIQ